jgi:hypothetical protein
MSGDPRRVCTVIRTGDKWFCKNEHGTVFPLEWQSPELVRCLTPTGTIKGHWTDEGIAWYNSTFWAARAGNGAKDQRIELNFDRLRPLLPKHNDKFNVGGFELTLKDIDKPPFGFPPIKAIEATDGGLLIRAYWDAAGRHGRINIRVRCAVVRGLIRVEGIDILYLSCTDENPLLHLADLKGLAQKAANASIKDVEKELTGAFGSSRTDSFLGLKLSVHFKPGKATVTIHDAN